jgi:hypothetical protein
VFCKSTAEAMRFSTIHQMIASRSLFSSAWWYGKHGRFFADYFGRGFTEDLLSLQSVNNSFTRKKARRAITAHIRDDQSVTRRSQQRSNIDITVNAVGPAVQKHYRRTIVWPRFSVSNIQEVGIDPFSEPNEVLVHDLIVVAPAGSPCCLRRLDAGRAARFQRNGNREGLWRDSAAMTVNYASSKAGAKVSRPSRSKGDVSKAADV